ncbi:hypothetical protein Pmani_036449 [Petrolisthes manimaculis]|uniref:Uncharacterized protein n=1 Tax=Petrolisthes manimaculis TaxID=1843537 RepID=A0AAE1NK49_9EUCA|nr:hypothetical protein Pmani_036449 [Petrolisthes manimaculis]
MDGLDQNSTLKVLFSDQREVLGKTATVSRLKSSVTVMTARHPLARLVSAFRDKFADGRKLDKPQSKDHFM